MASNDEGLCIDIFSAPIPRNRHFIFARPTLYQVPCFNTRLDEFETCAWICTPKNTTNSTAMKDPNLSLIVDLFFLEAVKIILL